jgi:hypothetical protein
MPLPPPPPTPNQQRVFNETMRRFFPGVKTTLHPNHRTPTYFQSDNLVNWQVAPLNTKRVEFETKIPGVRFVVRMTKHGEHKTHLNNMYLHYPYDPARHPSWHGMRNMLKHTNIVHLVNAAQLRRGYQLPLTVVLLASGKRAGMYSNLVEYPEVLHKALRVFKERPIPVTNSTTLHQLLERMRSALANKLSKADLEAYNAVMKEIQLEGGLNLEGRPTIIKEHKAARVVQARWRRKQVHDLLDMWRGVT